MPDSGRTDAEILTRAERDANGSLWDAFVHSFEEVKPTFDTAYHRMSNQGKPAAFVLKTGAIGLGAVIMADGVYHLVAGADERVEDLFLQNEKSRNYTRMFTGACELIGGAMLAYAGAVKGPVR